ncbi:MAG: aconitase X swivel domain-containing protein [Nitrososphaerales archaeon]
MRRVLKARGLIDGLGSGEALISSSPISFLEGVDPEQGKIIDKHHELFGLSIDKKVLVFPHSIGSSVGAYVLYKLKKNGKAPSAIINLRSDNITVSGCAIAKIPLVDMVEGYSLIRKGDFLTVDGSNGSVIVY